MMFRYLAISVSVLILLAGGLQTASAKVEDEDMELLSIVEEGVRSNINSIPHLKCNSHYKYGKADSLDEALSFACSSKATASGYYATDGHSERFDLIYPEEVTRQNEQMVAGGKLSSRFEPSKAQVFEKRIANFSPYRSVAIIQETQINPELAMVCPFDGGPLFMPNNSNKSLLGMIEMHRRGEIKFDYKGEISLDGETCWLLQFINEKAGSITQFWVLPNYGFCTPLIKTSLVDTEKDVLAIRSKDFKQCGEKGWLPQRRVVAMRIERGKDRPDEFRFRQIDFEQFETDDLRAEEDIALNLPKGVKVFDAIANFQWDSSNESICPKGILDLRSYDSQEALQVAESSPLIPIPNETLNKKGTTFKFWIILINALILTIIFLIFLVKRYA